MKINVVVVDDHVEQANHLAETLERDFPELRIIGVYHSVDTAVMGLKKGDPDLVFLDIVLGEGTGFDVLEQTGDASFGVIFTTSHDSYMLRALQLSAVDYLLKPFGVESIKAAVERFHARRSHVSSQLPQLLYNLKSETSLQRIALPTVNGYLFATADEIVRCEAVKSFTTVFLEDKRQIVLNRSIRECEDMLIPMGFCRIHQSHLVNLSKVKEYRKGDGGSVVLLDGLELDVSRRQKTDFILRLQRI